MAWELWGQNLDYWGSRESFSFLKITKKTFVNSTTSLLVQHLTSFFRYPILSQQEVNMAGTSLRVEKNSAI